MTQFIDISARIRRKSSQLPVFVLIPQCAIDYFAESETFIVEAVVNGSQIGRRSIKPWGDGRWFMELNKQQCSRAQVSEGDEVQISMRAAIQESTDLLDAVEYHGLMDVWKSLSKAQRRSLSEPVFEAKRDSIKNQRIERAVTQLSKRFAQQ